MQDAFHCSYMAWSFSASNTLNSPCLACGPSFIAASASLTMARDTDFILLLLYAIGTMVSSSGEITATIEGVFGVPMSAAGLKVDTLGNPQERTLCSTRPLQ